jgi:hypothetical protein
MLRGERPSSTQQCKHDYMRQTTATRAQENLCYVASANHVGGPRSVDSYSAGHVDGGRAPDYLGHSTIAGPAFPRFSQILAEAGDTEEMVSATVSFEKLHRWEPIFPWRDWRKGQQVGASQLTADEFAALANPDCRVGRYRVPPLLGAAPTGLGLDQFDQLSVAVSDRVPSDDGPVESGQPHLVISTERKRPGNIEFPGLLSGGGGWI